MNLSFKHLVASAAFIATSAVGAAPQYDWTVTSGDATVTLTDYANNVLRATATTLVNQRTIPNVMGLSNPGSVNAAVYVKTAATINLALTGGAADDTGVSSLHSDNSLVQFRRSWEDDDGNFIQYSVFATDWSFDLSNATIYANLYSQDHGAAIVKSLGRVSLFQASLGANRQVVQDTVDVQGNMVAHVTGTFNGPLRFDPTTVDLILAGLQLPTDSRGTVSQVFNNPTQSWGTVSFSAQMVGTPAVPEPSSYALIAAGLAALTVVKRKRA